MLPPSLRARLVFLIVYVAATSAAPPINARPKSWSAIASTHGSTSTFSGVSVNYDPAPAANLDDPGTFTSSIEPSNPFVYVGANNTLKDLDATVEGIANVNLSRNFAVSPHVHDKRAHGGTELNPQGPRIQDCSAPYEQTIRSVIERSRESLRHAILGLRTPGSSSSRANFVLWFGEYSESRIHAVLNNLGRISSHVLFPGFTIQCCDVALGYPIRLVRRDRLIQICTPFWTSTQPGQVGALLTFASVLVPLDKQTTGLVAARNLALTAPREVLTNVDNYVTFIMKLPDPIHPDEYPLPLYEHPPSYDPPPYNGRRDYGVSNFSDLPMGRA